MPDPSACPGASRALTWSLPARARGNRLSRRTGCARPGRQTPQTGFPFSSHAACILPYTALASGNEREGWVLYCCSLAHAGADVAGRAMSQRASRQRQAWGLGVPKERRACKGMRRDASACARGWTWQQLARPKGYRSERAEAEGASGGGGGAAGCTAPCSGAARGLPVRGPSSNLGGSWGFSAASGDGAATCAFGRLQGRLPAEGRAHAARAKRGPCVREGPSGGARTNELLDAWQEVYSVHKRGVARCKRAAPLGQGCAGPGAHRDWGRDDVSPQR